MNSPTTKSTKGRSSGFNPANRFVQFSSEPIWDDLEKEDFEKTISTQYYDDHSKSILSKNDSPDIPFTYGLNPYRGCEHGCIYCYARPSHEYLGFSSGMDFETKIMIKRDAPKLLEKEFQKKSWHGEVIALSGNTDCYQPIERKLEITRNCLKIFLDYRNPVRLITKNYLITRDVDILREMASLNLVGVMISITTLDRSLARRMEPRTSAPENRLKAIELLAKNNIPVGVLSAPIIPGLNDHEIPQILKQAADAGATTAGYTMIRLSHSLKELFADWLSREFPTKKEKILNSIRDVRGGELTDSSFGKRMRGEGEVADHISNVFRLFADKYNLNKTLVHTEPAKFRSGITNQEELF